MDGTSQPIYTQAIAGTQPNQSPQAAAAASTSTTSALPPPVVVAPPVPVGADGATKESTPGLASTTDQLAAAHIAPSQATSAESAASASTSSGAPLHPGQPQFHPFPDQDPAGIPLTGFASVPSRAAVLPNAQPYTRPTPYEPPAVQLGKGLSTSAPQRRFVTDQELKASLTNGNSDLGRTPGVVHEDEVKTLSVEDLKRMGLGRLPSGTSLLGRKNFPNAFLTSHSFHHRKASVTPPG